MADRVVRAIITGSSAGAVRAFEETSLAAERAGNKSARAMEESSTRTGGAWGKLGGFAATAGVAVVGAAAVITGAAVDMAAKFQQSMTLLVTGAGESQANLKLVGDGILAMAGQVGVMPEELAKGMYMIESAGYHGAAGLTVLRTAAEGAKVGGADMATVADALTTALNAYHLPASNAVSVTNTLIAAVSVGKTHMADMAASMGAIVPIAAALHVPLTQITAGMATMTMQGTDATKASQSLRFLLSALAGPTSAAAKEMQAMGIGMKEITGITATTTQSLQGLGIHTTEVADTLAHKGLPAALQMITDAIGKKFPAGSAAYEAALKGAVGGTRGMTAALELTGKGMDTYQANLKTITAAATKGGSEVSGFARTQQDLAAKMNQAKAAVSAMMIQLGQMLLPVVTTVANFINQHVLPALQSFFNTIQQHMPQISAGFAIFGQVCVTTFTVLKNIITTVVEVIIAIITRLVIIIQAIVGVVQAVVIRVQVIIGVLVSVFSVAFDIIKVFIAAFVIEFNIIRTVVEVVVNALKLPISILVNLFTLAFYGIRAVVTNVLVPVIQSIVGVVRGVVSVVGTVIGGITGIFSNVFGGLARIVSGVAAPIGAAIRGIVAVAKGIIDGVITAINWVIGVIDAIQVHIHFGPVNLDWGGVGIPKIPMLDAGGIVTSPTLALLAMNSRPEAVVPLGSGGAGATPTSVTLNFYGVVDPQSISNIVVDSLKRYQAANGNVPITVSAAQRLGAA